MTQRHAKYTKLPPPSSPSPPPHTVVTLAQSHVSMNMHPCMHIHTQVCMHSLTYVHNAHVHTTPHWQTDRQIQLNNGYSDSVSQTWRLHPTQSRSCTCPQYRSKTDVQRLLQNGQCGKEQDKCKHPYCVPWHGKIDSLQIAGWLECILAISEIT